MFFSFACFSYAGDLTVDGKLGVGTDSPSAKVDVKGAGTGTGVTLRTQDAAGVGNFVVLDNGFVGIGTTSPYTKLTVLGEISWGAATVSSIVGANQGGCLELGGTDSIANPFSAAKPYIDFHYGTGTIQDYNVRLQNYADNQFNIVTASGGVVMTVLGNRVGIGTQTPGSAHSSPSSVALDVGGKIITGVATPQNASDAVNKSYVDASAGGGETMQAVQVNISSTSSSSPTTILDYSGQGTLHFIKVYVGPTSCTAYVKVILDGIDVTSIGQSSPTTGASCSVGDGNCDGLFLSPMWYGGLMRVYQRGSYDANPIPLPFGSRIQILAYKTSTTCNWTNVVTVWSKK